MKMSKTFAVILIIFCLPSMEARKISQRDKSNMKKPIEFMTKADSKLNRLYTAAAKAAWNWQVNITEENLKVKENASKIASDYSRKVYLDAKKYPWKSYKGKNSTLYRWFELTAQGLGCTETSVLYEGKEDDNPYSKMVEIFGKAKVCPPAESTGECTSEVSEVFSKSKDPKELKHYWLEFRKETGEKYKDLFLEAIKEDNEGASKFGYKNKAAFNRALYEDKDFVKNIAEELKKILPFYKQIHAYVRKKLKKHYKSENIKSDGPIPAHLLGNQYAQNWNNIFEIVKPYPNSSGLPNVTKAMNKKKIKVIDMFMMAEKFFTSIELPQMTPRFWHYSMIRRPEGREVDCHASAHNFHTGKDYRIKMCTKVDSNDLEIIHHEMGHIEYFMLYNNLSFVFQDSANPGFHEAIGDAVSLSVLTPSYLKQVGLLKKNDIKKNNEFTINYLLQIALRYAVTVPYAYILDHWRNKVYEETIKDTELNKKYWQHRLQYQGVCPPSERTEEHFDIGAKWHIAGGVEYFRFSANSDSIDKMAWEVNRSLLILDLRYYVANILQFQIHKILCKEAGHKGPLHECNIYKNKKAGKAFAKFLSQGKSKNWKTLLNSFSGGAYKKLDASALLEYFKPLMDWLKKNNAKEYIGWKSDDPMSCPGDEEPTGTDATGTSDSDYEESTDSDATDTIDSDEEESTDSDATDTSDSDEEESTDSDATDRSDSDEEESTDSHATDTSDSDEEESGMEESETTVFITTAFTESTSD